MKILHLFVCVIMLCSFSISIFLLPVNARTHDNLIENKMNRSTIRTKQKLKRLGGGPPNRVEYVQLSGEVTEAKRIGSMLVN